MEAQLTRIEVLFEDGHMGGEPVQSAADRISDAMQGPVLKAMYGLADALERAYRADPAFHRSHLGQFIFDMHANGYSMLELTPSWLNQQTGDFADRGAGLVQ